MEALIHHFKLITEGFRVPAGQAYAAMCEGGMVADLIPAIASIDPIMGGVDR